MSYLGTTKIGKMYLGNTEIAKAYLGNTLVFQKGGSPSPTAIPYVRMGGSGASYINTGITPDNTVKVIVWARNFNPGGGYLFGSQSGGTSDLLCVLAPSDGNAGKIKVNYGTDNTHLVDDGYKYLSCYHKYELYQGVLKIDDVVMSTTPDSTWSSNYPIHLIGTNNAGTHANSSAPLPIDICAAQIYKDGVLVRDYTAVNSPSVGLYDAVSDTVFTNAGGGSFTYGTFEMSSYTRLAYVECTARAYFDTGIYGSYSLPIIALFRPGGTTAAWRNLLGARTSASSGRCDFQIGNDTDLNRVYSFCYQTAQNVVYNTESQAWNDLVWLKKNNSSTLYKAGTQLGTKTGATGTSFTTSYTMYIGAMNNAGSAANGFLGRLYHIGFGASANYVPMSYNGVAGFYDTYNDTFHASASENPFVAGQSITPTHYFRNKNISIIGDSISTFDEVGYKYDSYTMYYPRYDVQDVNQTYWKKLMVSENATLEINLSYSGSTVATRSGYPTLCDRIPLIGDCDTVMIALGTNDSANSLPLGDYSYEKTVGELDETYFREAYIKGIKMIQAIDPTIDIICIILSMDSDYRGSIYTIAQHYGLTVVDSGNDYAKCQGVHPSEDGMNEIYNNFLYV